MTDKGHSIINTEGDAYLEYSDFYDFSSSYPDCETADSEEAPETGDHKIWVISYPSSFCFNIFVLLF
jgi:hypothetical protein